MSLETTYWVVTALVFASVALGAFAAVSFTINRSRVRERYAASGSRSNGNPTSQSLSKTVQATFTPERMGLDAGDERKLRADLIKAGYFSPDAARVYTLVRLALAIFLPLTLYFGVTSFFGGLEPIYKFMLIAGAFLFAYYLPQAYVDRRQRLLRDRYQIGFPDFLDLLVVCVDAGLSLEAALERISSELGSKDPELRANLGIMSGEMRAGRSTIEALRTFAERLGLEEARSLAVLLHQSLELGTDIAQALTTYSEEMRDKRTARAEQKAYALPVKLTLPLGVFMFPVLMIVILTPVLIRMFKSFSVL